MVRIYYTGEIVEKIIEEEKLYFDFTKDIPECPFIGNYEFIYFYEYTFFSLQRYFQLFDGINDDFIVSSGVDESLSYKNNELIMDLSKLKLVFNPYFDHHIENEIKDYNLFKLFEALSDKIYIFSRKHQIAVYCSRYLNLSIVFSNHELSVLDDVSQSDLIRELRLEIDFSVFSKNFNLNQKKWLR